MVHSSSHKTYETGPTTFPSDMVPEMSNMESFPSLDEVVGEIGPFLFESPGGRILGPEYIAEDSSSLYKT